MRYISILLLVIILASSTNAQRYRYAGDYLFSLTYNVGIPAGNTQDYIDETSWSGFGIEIKRFLNSSSSVGFVFSWNIFDQRVQELAELENGHVYGIQVRNINVFPFLLNYHYYFGGASSSSSLKAYIGLNAGMYYIFQKFQLGVSTFDNDNWHFGIAPELGFTYPLSRSLFFLVNGKYNYAFDSGKRINGDEDNTHSFWGVNLGFSFAN